MEHAEEKVTRVIEVVGAKVCPACNNIAEMPPMKADDYCPVDCGEEKPIGEWEDLGPAEFTTRGEGEDRRPAAAVYKEGVCFAYELELDFFEVSQREIDDGEAVERDRAGWVLHKVVFEDPSVFLQKYEKAMLGMLALPLVDPTAGSRKIKNWYQARLVLAAAWVGARKKQRAEWHERTPWLYLPYIEGVVMDRGTRRWLAELMEMDWYRYPDFTPLRRGAK